MRNDDRRDKEDDVGVVIEGPSVAYTLTTFSVTIQLTNRSQRVKRLSLGIDEDNGGGGDGDDVTNHHSNSSGINGNNDHNTYKRFIPIDCLTKLRDLHPGNATAIFSSLNHTLFEGLFY